MSTIRGQANNGEAVTPSSTTDLPHISKGIYVTGAGNLVVTLTNMPPGTYLTFAATAAQFLPLEVKRVWATSTATGIIALYD
jgi:hypothetical protein